MAGSLSLDRLLFDPSDAAEGANVGAYIRAGSDGELIDSTSNALHVAVQNEVTVNATDFDIRDLSHSQDSVKIGDGTDFLAIAADGSIGVSQVGTWNVNLTDDSIADDAADSGNPFKVGGHAYTGASALGAVSSGDRVDLAMDLYRRVWVNDAPSVAALQQVVVVGTSAVALPAVALAGRKQIMIQNVSNAPIYVGSATVTSSGATQGIKVGVGDTLSLDCGQLIPLYAISAGTNKDVAVLEMG